MYLSCIYVSEESYIYSLSVIFFLVRTNRIMSTCSKNKIEKLGRCPSSGQIAKGCRCIQHSNWSSNSDKSRVINLLKDKGKSLPQSIEKQLRGKGLLSGNFICKTCAIFTKEFFDY